MLQNYFNRSRSKQYSYSSTIINLAVSCLLLGTQAQAAKTVKPSSAFSVYGTSTSVKDLEKENNKSFKIVGRDEADINKNLIYFKSPMGKSLIGKSVKELIIVSTPSGEKNFEILKVEYI